MCRRVEESRVVKVHPRIITELEILCKTTVELKTLD